MAKAALTTTEVKVDPELRAKVAVRAYDDSMMVLVNSDHLKLTEQEKHDLILQEKNLDELKKGDVLIGDFCTGGLNAGDISTNAKGKTTHAFALALCTHNHEAVQAFLQYVKPDEAPVDGGGHKWGAVHCVTDPVGHDSMFRYGPEKLNQILNMLDLLKTYDADFNFTPKGMYSNPPLALGDLQAVMGVPPKCKKTIAKILVIHGSNPFMLGTSGVTHYCKSWNVKELRDIMQESGASILARLPEQYNEALKYNNNTRWLTKYYGDLFEDKEEAVAAGGAGAGAGVFDVAAEVAADTVCTPDIVVKLAGDSVSATVVDTGEC